MHDDGLAYVKEADDASILNEDGEPRYQMAEGTAKVTEDLLEGVIESAEECPGECIFLQSDE